LDTIEGRGSEREREEGRRGKGAEWAEGREAEGKF
jgi:hypothetical protein